MTNPRKQGVRKGRLNTQAYRIGLRLGFDFTTCGYLQQAQLLTPFTDKLGGGTLGA